MFELAQITTSVFQSVNWFAFGERIFWAVGGGVVSLGLAYLALIRDVAYIKGTVTTIATQTASHGSRIDRLEVEIVNIKLALANSGVRVVGAAIVPPEQMS